MTRRELKDRHPLEILTSHLLVPLTTPLFGLHSLPKPRKSDAPIAGLVTLLEHDDVQRDMGFAGPSRPRAQTGALAPAGTGSRSGGRRRGRGVSIGESRGPSDSVEEEGEARCDG